MLELDHVFCIVCDPAEAVRRLEDDGWMLDEGQAHRGQGTRNRRLIWPELFFELVWVIDVGEARANPLRLDRRADWVTTGASPFGVGFRGRISSAESGEYWLYDALGPRIWVHRDNERFPERPLVFVLEVTADGTKRRRAGVHRRQPGDLREIHIQGPSAPSLPAFAGPPIVHLPGPHRLELVIGDEARARPVCETLNIVW